MTASYQRRRRHRSRFGLMRTVIAHHRSGVSDLLLSMTLAFVAGAINAGGFLAIGQYTSHMTGVVSAIADGLALGLLDIAGLGLLSLVSFIVGAGCSAIMINWGRRNVRRKQYAYPVALEALLLLVFGTLGWLIGDTPSFVLLATPLLCLIMGVQNATITKISGARMRTTHVTGMVTDIGIELGKLVFFHRNRRTGAPAVTGDLVKMGMLVRIVALFFLGGVVGALGFSTFGYVFAVPVAAVLMTLSTPLMMTRGFKLQERSPAPSSPDGIPEADVSRFTPSQPRPTGAIG
jgi:uncharacterized membrane protein YoaK (UPF0700 family)